MPLIHGRSTIRRRTLGAARSVGILLVIASATTPAAGGDLDLLVTPDAPGLVLLGTEPASVERPGTVADFTVVTLTATQRMSQVPHDYALIVAPYWLAGAKNLKYEDYARGGGDPMATFLQTLSFSVASADLDSVATETGRTGLGIGVRFSLVRGPVNPGFDEYARKLAELRAQLANLSTAINEATVGRKERDSQLRSLREQRGRATSFQERAVIDTEIAILERQIDQEVEGRVRREKLDEFKMAQEAAAALRVKRMGWQVDCAGGIAIDFPGGQFRAGDVFRTGAWVTVGHEGSTWTALSVARVLDDRTRNRSSIDIGARMIVQGDASWSVSAEGIYRAFLKSNVAADGRLAVVLDRAIGKSKSVTFTFGRGFESSVQGNLLAQLGLVLGFGTDRPAP